MDYCSGKQRDVMDFRHNIHQILIKASCISVGTQIEGEVKLVGWACVRWIERSGKKTSPEGFSIKRRKSNRKERDISPKQVPSF